MACCLKLEFSSRSSKFVFLQFSVFDWETRMHRVYHNDITPLLTICVPSTTARASPTFRKELLHTVILLDTSAPLPLLLLPLLLLWSLLSINAQLLLSLSVPFASGCKCRTGRFDQLSGWHKLYLIGSRQQRWPFWSSQPGTLGALYWSFFDLGGSGVHCLTCCPFFACYLLCRFDRDLLRRLHRHFRSSRRRLFFHPLGLTSCLTLRESRG